MFFIPKLHFKLINGGSSNISFIWTFIINCGTLSYFTLLIDIINDSFDVKFPNVNSIFSTFSLPDENGVNANINPNTPLSNLFIIKLTLIEFGSLYIIPLWLFPLVNNDLNISKLFIEFLSIKTAFWGNLFIFAAKPFGSFLYNSLLIYGFSFWFIFDEFLSKLLALLTLPSLKLLLTLLLFSCLFE